MDGYRMTEVALNYVATEVELTQDQINGVTPIVPANAQRRAIKFGGTDKVITLSQRPKARVGHKYAANFRDGEKGGDCHNGEWYLVPGQTFNVGDIILVSEASTARNPLAVISLDGAVLSMDGQTISTAF